MKAGSLNGKFIARPRIDALLYKGIKHKIIFISADIGWGKSTALSQWAKKQAAPVLWVDVGENKLSPSTAVLKQLQETGKCSGIMIFDNFHLLTAENYKEIIKYIEQSPPECRFILLSRSRITQELKPYAETYQLELITEEDLGFGDTEIEELFLNYGYSPDSQTLMKIKEVTGGWGIALNILLYTLKLNGGGFDQELYLQFREELYSYYDRTLFAQLSVKERRVFMLLSLPDEFSEELAVILTGMEYSADIIKNFQKESKSIIRIPPDTYRMNAFLKGYLEHRRNSLLTSQEIQEVYQKIGVWYESARDMAKAYDYYNRIGDYRKILKLLEENSERYLFTENFDELDLFYTAMPEDIILKSPVLCSNMVCLHAIRYRTEETNKWFCRLLSIRNTIPAEAADYRRHLEQRILYTSLILPGTGGSRLLKIFQNMLNLAMPGIPLMQRTSLTGNMPSILRGYKDLSIWGNHIDAIVPLFRPVAESLFQKKAAGAANICMAESFYEKNQLNSSLLEATKGLADAEKCGTPELIFTGYALLANIMAANRQLDTACSIMEKLSERIEASKVTGLISNYRAAMVRFHLLSGKKEQALEWLRTYAPDLKTGFRIFDCYKYLTEARVYLQNENYTQAMELLERLYSFYVDYKRPLDKISGLVLEAIALDRIGEEELSLSRLGEALRTAQLYKYIRSFADEGAACYRLLIKFGKTSGSGVEEKFLKEVTEAAKSFALQYPKYLEENNEVTFRLTKTEKEILQLLEHGMSNSEAAGFLDISIDTVKFHTKNIYSKLAVKNRMQAVIRGKELKIL